MRMSLAEEVLMGYNTGDAMAAMVAVGGYEKREVPVAHIDAHPDNREIDMAAVEQLAESIRREGLGQLPLVRALSGGRYQMIAGHHRLEAYRLLAGEDPEAYSTIPVVVKLNCDDDTALRLVWATNLHSAALTREERGHAYEVLAPLAESMREADPDAYRGVRTDDIIAELAAEAGNPVSGRTVSRDRAAYRGVSPDEADEAEKALKAFKRGVKRGVDAVDEGLLGLDDLEDGYRLLASLFGGA